jgi:hypothetical protein
MADSTSIRSSFPSRTAGFWAFPKGSPPPPPVTGADVQVALRPELQLPPVVVAKDRVIDGQDDLLTARIGRIRVGRRPVAGDDQCSDRVRIKNVKVVFDGSITRGKGHAQQTLFSPGRAAYTSGYFQEGVRLQGAIFNNPDPPRFFGYKDPEAVVAGVGDGGWLGQAADELV